MAAEITPNDREKLCDAIKGLCLQYGTDEVQEALAEVIDEIHEETGEPIAEDLEAEGDANHALTTGLVITEDPAQDRKESGRHPHEVTVAEDCGNAN